MIHLIRWVYYSALRAAWDCSGAAEAGAGRIEQVLDDLAELRRLGADTVVLDPYHGDPEETRRPDVAWRALTIVATHWRTQS